MIRLTLSLRSYASLHPAEVDIISKMGSASLREAAESLVQHHRVWDPKSIVVVASAIATRAVAIRQDVHPWDLVSVIRSQSLAGESPSNDLLMDMLERCVSKLSPKHLIDLVACFDFSNSNRSKGVYKRILVSLVLCANGPMLADELVALVRVLARKNVASSDLWNELLNAVFSTHSNDKTNSPLFQQFRYLHCCELAGALAALGMHNHSILSQIQSKCKQELEVMPLDELWKTITKFSQLHFSHSDLESMAMTHLEQYLSTNGSNRQMFDQLTRPIEFLQFLRYNEKLSEETLIQACKWANDAVFRPAVRTEGHRRPSIFEVSLLADLCAQKGISQETVLKAVNITVKSAGGTVSHIAKPKPLRYRKGRVYVRAVDGYVGSKVSPVENEAESKDGANRRAIDASFAPKLRSLTSVPLWKERSNAWYCRK